MTNVRYTRTAIALHWLIALLIVGNVILAWTVDYLPEGSVRPVVDTHKSIGITVLGLALMRLLWRLSHAPPPLDPRYARWERLAAHAAHGLLYVLIFALPLSGWMHDSAWKDAATHPMRLFGLIPFPRIAAISGLEPVRKEALHTLFGDIHTWFGYALFVLLAAHVAGALKHQFLDRQPELQRMLPQPKSGGRP